MRETVTWDGGRVPSAPEGQWIILLKLLLLRMAAAADPAEGSHARNRSELYRSSQKRIPPHLPQLLPPPVSKIAEYKPAAAAEDAEKASC